MFKKYAGKNEKINKKSLNLMKTKIFCAGKIK